VYSRDYFSRSRVLFHVFLVNPRGPGPKQKAGGLGGFPSWQEGKDELPKMHGAKYLSPRMTDVGYLAKPEVMRGERGLVPTCRYVYTCRVILGGA
jgi:hypothetical protein